MSYGSSSWTETKELGNIEVGERADLAVVDGMRNSWNSRQTLSGKWDADYAHSWSAATCQTCRRTPYPARYLSVLCAHPAAET